MVEKGALHMGLVEDGPGHIRPAEIGLQEISSRQDCTVEISAVKERLDEVRIAEIGRCQIRPFEMSPFEAGLAQLRSDQRRVK